MNDLAGCEVPEITDRLTQIEANQKHTEKTLDRLVVVVEQLSQTQSDIKAMQSKINDVAERQKITEQRQDKIKDKVAEIDKYSNVNRTRIAATSATVTTIIGVCVYWLKTKI